MGRSAAPPYPPPKEPAKARHMPIPDATRYARDAAEAIEARFEDLDGGEGYLFRISRGSRFVLGGGGNVCTYPVNNASAYTISRDKAHTKAVLIANGIPIIPGGLYFAHTRRAALRAPGREAADALQFAAGLGYPVFCKPTHGSRGTFAEIVRSPSDLEDYIRRVAVEFESFLIEPVLDGAEHRVFVLDGRPIFHSTKSAPILIGDGRLTLGQLLAALNDTLQREGVSALPPSALAGHSLDTVPSAGAHIALPGRRNLSAQGSVESVSEHVPPQLSGPAIAAVAALGLRASAVDLFDISPARDLSDIVVIEVNGNPGLGTLEHAGRTDLIRAIWTHMLNACLSS
jgi:D-alanine-D-alanine ligase-like ATP-grasp enzyme